VASAIAFMAIAAASSAIMSAAKSNRAGSFYRQALLTAQQFHAENHGIQAAMEMNPIRVTRAEMPGGNDYKPGWMVLDLSDASTGRKLRTCLAR